MLEIRGKIEDIKRARNIAENLGANYKGHYSFSDIIFDNPKNGITMLRVFKVNNRRQRKNFIFTHKVPEWMGNIKKDKIILKEEFDSIEEALSFIIDHYDYSLQPSYEYSRDGWEYSLNRISIFIENIELIGPTIEIEAENVTDFKNLPNTFGIIEQFSEPIPVLIMKHDENIKKINDN